VPAGYRSAQWPTLLRESRSHPISCACPAIADKVTADCQGLAIDDYSLTSAELSRCPPLDALANRSRDPAAGEAGAPSTFAQLGFC